VTFNSNYEISNDIDTIVRQEHNEDDGMPSARRGLERIARVIYRDKDLYLPYCIAVSLLLHVVIFAVLPQLGKWAPARPFPSQGEQTTPVRLVELPPQQQQEKPPDNAAALSDRDHTAERQRLPKAVPAPKSPLGQVDSMPNRIAALPPPMAPEDFEKPKEEKRKLEEKADNEPAVQKPSKKGPLNGKHHSSPRPKRDPLKNRNVDLRPTPGEIARGLASPGGPSDFFHDGDPDETVVDINTREERFFSYLHHLKQKIQAVWIYPSVAAKAGIGGNLTVEFLISRDGELLGVNLLDSSGHTILDDSAISAIKSAAPFFPFPERLTAKRMRIRANFIYVTSNFLRNIM
jgi:periplasmic protein TonB